MLNGYRDLTAASNTPILMEAFKIPRSTLKDVLPLNKSGGAEAPGYKESRLINDMDRNYIEKDRIASYA